MSRSPAVSVPFVALIALLGAGLAGLCCGANGQDPPIRVHEVEEVRLPVDLDVPVLQYHVEIGMLAEPDPTPRLRVFADGRGLVYYPPYMKKAGLYELQLTLSQLEELLAGLVEKGLLEFDAERVRELRRQAIAERLEAARVHLEPKAAEGDDPPPSTELRAVSDTERTLIELRLAGYKLVDRPAVRGEIHREIAWDGLRSDVEFYPEIEALARLWEAEREIRTLLERDDLIRLE